MDRKKRHPIDTFEARPGFTRVTAHRIAHARGDLCHEASVPPVTQRKRSSASRPIDDYPAGILLGALPQAALSKRSRTRPSQPGSLETKECRARDHRRPQVSAAAHRTSATKQRRRQMR